MPPIKVKVNPDALSAEELAEEEKQEPKHPQISLQARKTIDGKIMIMDHRDIDIVVDPAGKKIITFPKESMTDEVYDSQNKYFHYLAQKGVVERNSVHSGDVFASLQAKYPDSANEGVDPTQVVLLSTYKFLAEERPRFESEEWLEEEWDDYNTYPTDEDSTELGEIPEEPSKGNIGLYGAKGGLSGYPYEE